ncbi:MAG: serine hydrolase, partial [Planctomycetales bacterium]|nr:serine hydrolase [Planctomycetales bacterium]
MVSRHLARFCLICTALLPLARAAAQATDTTTTPAPAVADGDSTADRLFADLRADIQVQVGQKQLPALSLLAYDGETQQTWQIHFGTDGQTEQRPVNGSTVYRVGSVSKLLTDLCVMRWVEQARLDLDVPIQTYLPDFAPHNPFGTPITLRMLMAHRAGLVRESPVGNYFDASAPGLQATVESLNTTTLVYQPGTQTKYSNAGIAVVGYVLEKLAGKSFEQVIEQELLKPIGMSASSFQRTESVAERQALGWMWTYDGRRFPAVDFQLGTLPAGNLYASLEDLRQLMRLVIERGRVGDQQLLQIDTVNRMLSPRLDADGNPLGYGIGFRVNEFEGQRRVGHGGAVYGYATQVSVLPDAKLGVAVVATLDGANGIVERIADQALRVMLCARADQTPPQFDSTSDVPAPRIVQLAGLYGNDRGRVRLERNGDRLLLHQGSFVREVRLDGDRMVVDDRFGLGVELQRHADESISLGDQRYSRLDDICPPAAPEKWRGLIGEYGWDHNTLFIYEEQGRLHALIEWFYDYPLQELNDNEFAFPDYGLYHGEKLVFRRNAGGEATDVIAASVTFPRRAVGTADGVTFKIVPLRPVEELRTAAMAASPPTETRPTRQPELVELSQLDESIHLDVRYATTNNFMNERFYEAPRAFLQRPAAEALVRVHRKLKDDGYGLLIHDAYRPWFVTKMFWDATPPDLRDFVANPANGSRHNRGCAVDLTLYELASGRPVLMVSGYDEFSPRAFPEYAGGSERQRWHRRLLRTSMESAGFTVYEFEWWHFDYADWREYPLMNSPFSAASLGEPSRSG